MEADGYKDAGYQYIIIDDCWMEKERDPITKELVPDRKRFPNGMKPLADYVCVSVFFYKFCLFHLQIICLWQSSTRVMMKRCSW